MKLLIIDGNRERRQTLKRIFQDDFSVTTLSSGQEALAFARCHIFEVVMMSETINTVITPATLLKTLKKTNTEFFIAFLLTSRPHLTRDEHLAGFHDVVNLAVPVEELYKKIVVSASLYS
jgi:CheY-like chemotaxis protein